MATDLICGTGGSTGAEVIGRINDLSQLDPRATGRIATPITVTIDDSTHALLPMMDTVVTQRGGFEVDLGTQTLVNNSGAKYNSVIVTIGLNVKFPGTESLDLWVYVNDQQYSASEFTVRGMGDHKPQSIFWQSDVTLQDGDRIDVRGVNANNGSYDLTIERTQFRIDSDYKDNIG